MLPLILWTSTGSFVGFKEEMDLKSWPVKTNLSAGQDCWPQCKKKKRLLEAKINSFPWLFPHTWVLQHTHTHTQICHRLTQPVLSHFSFSSEHTARVKAVVKSQTGRRFEADCPSWGESKDFFFSFMSVSNLFWLLKYKKYLVWVCCSWNLLDFKIFLDHLWEIMKQTSQ